MVEIEKVQKFVDIIMIIRNLNQQDGDSLMEVLSNSFTFEDIAAVSAFFHETCRLQNQKSILTSALSDFKG